MDRFLITGGKKLSGMVRTDGSKNAALPIIVASLLIDEGETVLENIPPLRDIKTISQVLENLGATIDYDARAMRMIINASDITQDTAPYDLMRKMRASFLVLGPLLARLGQARVSLPGGCNIGARPVDYHIAGFADLGAAISVEAGYVVARAKPLKGAVIHFDRPSHTGTENLIFGAVLAEGTTQIINAACDPEVVDVANGGSITVDGINPSHLTMVSRKLYEMGCEIAEGKESIKIKAPKNLSPVKIVTYPYPGFPTDLQPCFMSLATVASGTSHIRETIYEDRLRHTMELQRLGADITVTSDEATINGVKNLKGAGVMASDIRAGAGLAVACLAAKGTSELLRVYHIDRAYYQLEEKLLSLGADIKREKE